MYDVHVEALVPVGVQRLLDDARGARLLAIDRGHGEGVRKACSTCMSDLATLVS
jgi:hypothetical protein